MTRVAFSWRVALAAALAVTIAVIAASAAAYVLARDQFVGELDRSLVGQLERRGGRGLQPIEGRLGGPGAYVQLVTEGGQVRRPPGATVALPLTESTRAVLSGARRRTFEDVRVADTSLRVLTVSVRPGIALQLARPRDEVDTVLRRLRRALAAVGLAGVALAGLLGLLVSRTALAPLRQLADAAEDVAETGDLSRRVGIAGDDELGRLGSRFDTMLAALESSETARRTLIADASHELRTPVTSIRTNVELLQRHPALGADERGAAFAAALAELDELSSLVTDIVELARGSEAPAGRFEELRLDELVEHAAERTRRAAPGLTVAVTVEPVVMSGMRDRLYRAVTNLLDNARKWSPVGSAIEVTVTRLATGTRGTPVAVLEIRDHGPGFPEHDLAHVFERFFRSTEARGLPGSGLGLAIVAQVAELHGGTVSAANHPAGGAVVRLELPAGDS